MAKREITSEEGVSLKSPVPPKAQERELAEATEYMVAQISKLFRNQTLGELNKGTINKFSDAQTGNYAKVFLALANTTRRKLVKRFDDKRIDALVSAVLSKVDKRNQKELYGLVERKIGINSASLAATEGLKPTFNALKLETSQWVKKLRDDTIEMYTANSLRSMALGTPLTEILAGFDVLVEKRKDHAKFTARNQITNFNSITTKIRAQNLGITKAIWITARDERVRPSHEQRDGKEFDLNEGLYSSIDGKDLLPGVDFNCRCTYELIVPED